MEFPKDEVKNKVVWTKGADFTDGSPRYTFEGRDPATTYERFQVVIYTEMERRYAHDPGSLCNHYYGYVRDCALPGFVDSKNEEKTERNAGYLVVSHSGGGMLRQGTRKGIRRTPANRGMRAHWVVKGLDISEDVCHGMCP